MRLPLLLLLLAVGCTTMQTFRTTPNRLLYSSADVSRPNVTADPSVRAVRKAGFFSNDIVTVKQDGSQTRVPENTLWGYVDKDGKVWRRYRKDFLEVRQIGVLVEYIELRSEQRRVNGRTQYSRNRVSLFSRTLDSPIYQSRSRALRDNPDGTN